MVNIAIYVRVSTSQQAEKGTSPQKQRELGLEYASKNGFTPILYEDLGISASYDELEHRPQFARMISDMKRGEFKRIWVLNQERISRSNFITGQFVYELQKAGAIVIVDGKEVDLLNPEAELIFTIVGAVAKFSAAVNAANSKDSKRRLVAKGYSAGRAGIAYGYDSVDKKVVVHPEESEIVKQIFQWCIDGKSTPQIARELSAKGIPTKDGKISWADGVIRRMIANPLYKGERPYKGEYYRIEAIVSKELWKQANHAMKSRNNSPVRAHNNERYHLNGLLFCQCGEHMLGRYYVGRKIGTYRCATKNRKNPKEKCTFDGISLEVANEAVKWVFDNFYDEDIDLTSTRDDVKYLSRELDDYDALLGLKSQHESAITKANQMFKLDSIDYKEFEATIKKHKFELQRVEDRILEFQEENEVGNISLQELDKANGLERNELFRKAIRRINWRPTGSREGVLVIESKWFSFKTDMPYLAAVKVEYHHKKYPVPKFQLVNQTEWEQAQPVLYVREGSKEEREERLRKLKRERGIGE